MSRRLTTLLLSVFYLLQATWLLHAGMDLLLPKAREIAASLSDSCCSSGCGCPEDAKAARTCCCVTRAAAEEAPKKAAPRSAIEEARCKGVEAAMTQAFTQPVLCAFATIGLPVLDRSSILLTHPQPLLPQSSSALDKVPIA
jgi:hypothetical protein